MEVFLFFSAFKHTIVKLLALQWKKTKKKNTLSSTTLQNYVFFSPVSLTVDTFSWGKNPPTPHHKRKSLSTGSIYKRDVLYGVDDSLTTLNPIYYFHPMRLITMGDDIHVKVKDNDLWNISTVILCSNIHHTSSCFFTPLAAALWINLRFHNGILNIYDSVAAVTQLQQSAMIVICQENSGVTGHLKALPVVDDDSLKEQMNGG